MHPILSDLDNQTRSERLRALASPRQRRRPPPRPLRALGRALIALGTHLAQPEPALR